MKVFYFIICILIFYQCKNTQNIQEYPTLNVTIEGDFQGIPADSLFSSVTYIPLETSKHSLLASMNKVQIHDSTIYIYWIKSKRSFLPSIQMENIKIN